MNILIVRVSSLGDIVHNMPMLADIKHHYPDADIDWVVEEAYVNLVLLNQYVRYVFPIALRRWRQNLYSMHTYKEISLFFHNLRQYKYNIVFDTQGLLKTGVIMRCARSSQRIGLANSTKGSSYEVISRVFHTYSVPINIYTHAVLRARIVAAAALGYKINQRVNFGLLEDKISNFTLSKKFYAIFFHGTTRVAKLWPIKCWVFVARLLNKRKMPVLLPWSTLEEKETAYMLAKHVPNVIVLPSLSLIKLVMLIKYASLIIGVDTGLTHISAALCRPTIELYCDSPRWSTEGNWSSKIINLGDLGAMPNVVQVMRAINTLIAAIPVT